MIIINNIEDFKNFLKDLGVGSKDIDEFVKDKEIVINNYGLFLSGRSAEKRFLIDELIFVNLKRIVPTIGFLKKISKIGRCYEVKNFKEALNYTYGKDVVLRSKQEEGLCLMRYKHFILGLGRIKGRRIMNVFNVGEYLREI